MSCARESELTLQTPEGTVVSCGIELNEHRCLSKLGTQAIYRILSFDDALVWVEVVSAPGLEPGRRLRLTRAAVEAMRLWRPDRAPAPSRQPQASLRYRPTQ